jgi:hypothetical protein
VPFYIDIDIDADNIHDKRNFHSRIISWQSWHDNRDEQLTIGKYECHSLLQSAEADVDKILLLRNSAMYLISGGFPSSARSDLTNRATLPRLEPLIYI